MLNHKVKEQKSGLFIMLGNTELVQLRLYCSLSIFASVNCIDRLRMKPTENLNEKITQSFLIQPASGQRLVAVPSAHLVAHLRPM